MDLHGGGTRRRPPPPWRRPPRRPPFQRLRSRPCQARSPRWPRPPCPRPMAAPRGVAVTSSCPIVVALVVLGAGAAYLLSRRNRPSDPFVIRDGLGRLAARVSGAIGLAIGLAIFLPATVAAHSLNATYTSRLPLAVYLVGAATTVALSFIFVIVRDVRAAPPDLDAEGSCRLHGSATRCGPGPDRLDLDHRPGHRRKLERRRRRDALPVGLRLGRAGDHLRAHRTGLALPRSVLDPPRHRRLGPAAARRPGLGDRGLP